MEKQAATFYSPETIHESKWVRLVDHTTEAGEHLVVIHDVYRPDEPEAYAASIEDDAGLRKLEVEAAYETTNSSRRWQKRIDFIDGSRIVIEVQRFEMRYVRGQRVDFMMPCPKSPKAIDL